MANPFENYDFDRANEVFVRVKRKLDATAANRRFIAGDDWQDGAGWVGPHFDGNTEVSRQLKKDIARDFASKGDIKSVVRRHRRGVIGRVPTWLVASRDAPSDPTAENKKDAEIIAEAQKILNEFWKQSRFHQTLKDFVEDYLASGRAVLRLFFVQNDSDGNAVRAAVSDSIESAVKLLHVFKEAPDAGCVVWDKETLRRASVFRYELDGNVFIELCYVRGDGQTIFKTFAQNGDAAFARRNFPTSLGRYANARSDESQSESDGLPLPLDGKLLVFEITGEPLVSPAMRSQQKLVNKAYTMMSHNLDMDGFRSKKILNGLPPGKFEKNEKGDNVFVPDPNGERVGAGIHSYTQGLPITERSADGTVKTGYTTPQVHESNPIPVATFVESAAAGTEAILEEADQKHIAISGDAAASGESRIQARDEYRQSLEDTKSVLDDAVSETLETVLAVVAYLMGKPSRYAGLQVTFNAILNPGPVSADQRRVTMDEADKKYRSRESAMEGIGITDPDAMKAKIKQETGEIEPPTPTSPQPQAPTTE